MLKAHLDAVEAALLATSRIPANTGHSLHKGTPREAFIKEFLEGHLSERVAVGTGEIIDCHSSPNPPSTAQRHQYDIVLYKRDYPRLEIGGGIFAFLAESVVATIEVKSTLDSDELKKSIRAARSAKQLTRNVETCFRVGFQPPSILSYVVAYEGPAKMTTVHGWVNPIHTELGISPPTLPMGRARLGHSSPSIDGVFVLGKGFLVFDNVPSGFASDQNRQMSPGALWQLADHPSASLLYLFLLLTTAVSGISGSWLNPLPYLSNFRVANLSLER
jgi:hypothetical protein